MKIFRVIEFKTLKDFDGSIFKYIDFIIDELFGFPFLIVLVLTFFYSFFRDVCGCF